jgi:hypothetical protein
MGAAFGSINLAARKLQALGKSVLREALNVFN